MNLPRISLSKPSFSPRFFIYFLFGLVILVLAVEGGYYFWTQRKEKARLQATDWVNLIEGKINKIEGRTLIITVNDFNSVIPRKVEIEVDSETEIFITPSPEEFKKFLLLSEEEFVRQLDVIMPPILFANLKVGDIIQAGILTKIAEAKFKAESIAVIKE